MTDESKIIRVINAQRDAARNASPTRKWLWAMLAAAGLTGGALIGFEFSADFGDKKLHVEFSEDHPDPSGR